MNLPSVLSLTSGYRAHIRCGEVAPMDCGLRPARAGGYHDGRERSASPLAKAKNRKSLSIPVKQ